MSEALHSQLIHPASPPPIPWWPPAPGWWLLAGAAVLLALLLPWLIRKARRHKRRRRAARRILHGIPADLPAAQWLAAINTRLKQLLKQRGDTAATLLYGEAWIDYLCSHYPDAQRNVLAPLAADLYRPDVQLSNTQRQALQRELTQWLRHNHV